ncbi:carboxynorspermidine decarboxylase (plasmid) [Leisingera sp. S132]|uniref:carboxynorspermidine decarboxylase n=1 Tax=Leisingera sp. S132 TaxID=2867016 RepID=UPI0021A6B8E0|nr:carboxynorspermidine decarboxylase [Leisingera sp. S132]UWQ81669.1 carboxynorspermidine decarboxylase [Leisingera sp. S132]
MDIKALSTESFARFDLHRVPSPCFVVDEAAVERNLSILKGVADASGANVLLALKAFSMFAVAPLVRRYLSGTCASGLYEARLAREEFGGEVTTYSAGFKADDLPEIIRLSDHLIFNSPAQHRRFAPLIAEARAKGQNISIGLRVNPEHSEGWNEKYDPTAPCSRLGTPVSQLTDQDWDGVEGLHMHTLCEQLFEPLQRTFAALEAKMGHRLKQLKWINLGGGHHITMPDYDRDGLTALIRHIRETYGVEVFIEPGEAVALHSGILVGEILDVAENSMPLAITDISATCHMPDVIEAPYRPDLLGEVSDVPPHRLGGPSCLAGDVIGDYGFATPPQPGDRIAFLDQSHYSMVKTNTFNGVPLPAIALWNSETDALKLLRTPSYDDFKDRLS